VINQLRAPSLDVVSFLETIRIEAWVQPPLGLSENVVPVLTSARAGEITQMRGPWTQDRLEELVDMWTAELGDAAHKAWKTQEAVVIHDFLPTDLKHALVAEAQSKRGEFSPRHLNRHRSIFSGEKSKSKVPHRLSILTYDQVGKKSIGGMLHTAMKRFADRVFGQHMYLPADARSPLNINFNHGEDVLGPHFDRVDAVSMFYPRLNSAQLEVVPDLTEHEAKRTSAGRAILEDVYAGRGNHFVPVDVREGSLIFMSDRLHQVTAARDDEAATRIAYVGSYYRTPKQSFSADAVFYEKKRTI